ncbi:MAG TPA: hypothetical protein VD965_00275 [Burkholderiales bacterium]|nr:hypothetical protein [Burkholderiales bacterium]
MSAPAGKKEEGPAEFKDPNLDLAKEIFIYMSAQIYTSNAPQKPDPKALAQMCFKLAEAFDGASKETPKVKAFLEAQAKAAVKLDNVDLSDVFAASKK